MTTTYNILVDGKQVATMTADFAQASSPILLDGESTPYQVADARHRTGKAAEMLLEWCHSSGGALCEMDEDNEVVGSVTVEECETVEA
jgi:hypothetical protein